MNSENSENSETCIVCFETINDDIGKIKTKCGHIYCVSCFVYHMRVSNTCGYCRFEIVPKKPKEPHVMDHIIRMNITDFIMTSFRNDNGLTRMYANLTNKFNALLEKALQRDMIVLTRSTTNIINICRELLPDIRLEYDLWHYTMNCVDSVNMWYENDDHPIV